MEPPLQAAYRKVLLAQTHETEEGMMKTYKIVRFRFDGDSEVVVRGLTLEQVQAHCCRDDTHGEGWFDGYEEEM